MNVEDIYKWDILFLQLKMSATSPVTGSSSPRLALLVRSPLQSVNGCLCCSQGHACPGLYGVLVEAGVIPEEHLKTLRRIDSDLEGHPTPVSSVPLFSWVWCVEGSVIFAHM